MVNSGAGLLKFDGNIFDRIDMDDYFIVKSVKIDKSDKIWCGDFSGKNKYGVLFGQSWIYNSANLTESVVTAIEQAPDGKMWLGTESGIHIVSISAMNISSFANQ
jgi:ligand-binding sensor domain-containing protein